jgi:hypothetical protein
LVVEKVLLKVSIHPVGIKSVTAKMKGRTITADMLYVKGGERHVKTEYRKKCPADLGLHHEEPPVFAVLSFNDKANACEGCELQR